MQFEQTAFFWRLKFFRIVQKWYLIFVTIMIETDVKRNWAKKKGGNKSGHVESQRNKSKWKWWKTKVKAVVQKAEVNGGFVEIFKKPGFSFLFPNLYSKQFFQLAVSRSYSIRSPSHLFPPSSTTFPTFCFRQQCKRAEDMASDGLKPTSIVLKLF